MNTSAAIADPSFRLRRSYLVKPASTQRGEREAQDGKNVSVSGMFVCEMRDTLQEQRDSMRFRPATPRSCQGLSLSGVEGATNCHE
jgi:hypothetical protein